MLPPLTTMQGREEQREGREEERGVKGVRERTRCMEVMKELKGKWEE